MVTIMVSPFYGVFVAGCVALSLYAVLTRWGPNHGRLPNDPVARTFWSLLAGGLLVGFTAPRRAPGYQVMPCAEESAGDRCSQEELVGVCDDQTSKATCAPETYRIFISWVRLQGPVRTRLRVRLPSSASGSALFGML